MSLLAVECSAMLGERLLHREWPAVGAAALRQVRAVFGDNHRRRVVGQGECIKSPALAVELLLHRGEHVGPREGESAGAPKGPGKPGK